MAVLPVNQNLKGVSVGGIPTTPTKAGTNNWTRQVVKNQHVHPANRTVREKINSGHKYRYQKTLHLLVREGCVLEM